MNTDRSTLRPYQMDAEVAGYDLTFVWHGGAYIDVCWRGGSAFEVINVWDYAVDVPTINRTQEAFEARCQEWISDPETDHANDLRNYAF